MQVIESEMVIPFKSQQNFKNTLVTLCVTLAFGISFFVFWIMRKFKLVTDASRFPAIQESFRQDMISVVIGFALIFVLYALTFLFFFRQMRAPSCYVRISHEGIFTSRDSFLIKWAEIKELSPSTFMGSPYLRIVPWDLTEVASRAKISSGPFLRFGINLTLLLFGRSKSPAPIGISQLVLPITIDELLTAIQEHFATELHEHHILVRE